MLRIFSTARQKAGTSTLRRVLALAMVIGSTIALASTASKAHAQVWAGLKCMGHGPGRPTWLDGRTHNGTVGLAPNNQRPYTGTRWQVFPLEEGGLGIRSLGELPGNDWLDGRTHDGSVGLAPHAHYPFTGAQWRIHYTGNGFIQLESLGHLDGPRFLYGDPMTGTVSLTYGREAAGNYWLPVYFNQ